MPRYLTEAERNYITAALRDAAITFERIANNHPHLSEHFRMQNSECMALAEDIEQAEDIELS